MTSTCDGYNCTDIGVSFSDTFMQCNTTLFTHLNVTIYVAELSLTLRGSSNASQRQCWAEAVAGACEQVLGYPTSEEPRG
jgi:hypothetical protein